MVRTLVGIATVLASTHAGAQSLLGDTLTCGDGQVISLSSHDDNQLGANELRLRRARELSASVTVALARCSQSAASDLCDQLTAELGARSDLVDRVVNAADQSARVVALGALSELDRRLEATTRALSAQATCQTSSSLLCARFLNRVDDHEPDGDDRDDGDGGDANSRDVDEPVNQVDDSTNNQRRTPQLVSYVHEEAPPTRAELTSLLDSVELVRPLERVVQRDDELLGTAGGFEAQRRWLTNASQSCDGADLQLAPSGRLVAPRTVDGNPTLCVDVADFALDREVRVTVTTTHKRLLARGVAGIPMTLALDSPERAQRAHIDVTMQLRGRSLLAYAHHLEARNGTTANDNQFGLGWLRTKQRELVQAQAADLLARETARQVEKLAVFVAGALETSEPDSAAHVLLSTSQWGLLGLRPPGSVCGAAGGRRRAVACPDDPLRRLQLAVTEAAENWVDTVEPPPLGLDADQIRAIRNVARAKWRDAVIEKLQGADEAPALRAVARLLQPSSNALRSLTPITPTAPAVERELREPLTRLCVLAEATASVASHEIVVGGSAEVAHVSAVAGVDSNATPETPFWIPLDPSPRFLRIIDMTEDIGLAINGRAIAAQSDELVGAGTTQAALAQRDVRVGATRGSRLATDFQLASSRVVDLSSLERGRIHDVTLCRLSSSQNACSAQTASLGTYSVASPGRRWFGVRAGFGAGLLLTEQPALAPIAGSPGNFVLGSSDFRTETTVPLFLSFYLVPRNVLDARQLTFSILSGIDMKKPTERFLPVGLGINIGSFGLGASLVIDRYKRTRAPEGTVTNSAMITSFDATYGTERALSFGIALTLTMDFDIFETVFKKALSTGSTTLLGAS